MKEHDLKKRETIVEDMVGLAMTMSQSVHEPTLTRIGVSTRAWKERSKSAKRMELTEEAMVGPRRHELQPERADPA